jgi:hypothetical protein
VARDPRTRYENAPACTGVTRRTHHRIGAWPLRLGVTAAPPHALTRPQPPPTRLHQIACIGSLTAQQVSEACPAHPLPPTPRRTRPRIRRIRTHRRAGGLGKYMCLLAAIRCQAPMTAARMNALPRYAPTSSRAACAPRVACTARRVHRASRAPRVACTARRVHRAHHPFAYASTILLRTLFFSTRTVSYKSWNVFVIFSLLSRAAWRADTFSLALATASFAAMSCAW